jgi:hypothetical protein
MWLPPPTSGAIVSNTLRDRLIGSGLEFDDRGGIHTLKGVTAKLISP